VTSAELIFVYEPPLTVPRKTLYPATVEVLAFQVSATECCIGATPVPDRGIKAGDPVALLAIEMFPLLGPVEVGLNCAVRMRFCAGESVTGVLPPVTE
jgi:hypothetical protein